MVTRKTTTLTFSDDLISTTQASLGKIGNDALIELQKLVDAQVKLRKAADDAAEVQKREKIRKAAEDARKERERIEKERKEAEEKRQEEKLRLANQRIAELRCIINDAVSEMEHVIDGVDSEYQYLSVSLSIGDQSHEYNNSDQYWSSSSY